ncbi:hypothetical protein ACKKBF_B01410 [Auxenochlorella protothecoides x Auxenochlorella symbiontica]
MAGASPASQRAMWDEEELLQMQEDMKTLPRERLAAKVTRVVRKSAEAAPEVKTPPAVPLKDRGIQERMLGMNSLVGSVVEREVAGPTPPPTCSSTASAPAFPAAAHRGPGASRFSRARRDPGPTGAAASSPAIKGPEAALEPGSVEEASAALLSGMSLAEREEARRDLESRLKPETLAFLKARGARRQMQGPAAAEGKRSVEAGMAGPAHDEKSRPTAAGGKAVRFAPQPQESLARPAVAPGIAAQAGPKPSALPAIGPDSHDPAAEESLPPAARLLFDVSGVAVGLAPAAADVWPEEDGPAMRGPPDPDAHGLTLREACRLCRSSSMPQRVAALRTLRNVLAGASRGRQGGARQGPQLTRDAAALLAAEGLEPPSQTQLGRELLSGARATTVLRRALDETVPAVVAAAAGAVLALVDLSPPEHAVLEASDASPLSGCPSLGIRHAQRPSLGAAWVTAPLADDPRTGTPETVDGEHEEEPTDWELLGQADPLSALLGMGLLDRVAYLLREAATFSGATTSLLALLVRICRMGPDACSLLVANAALVAAMRTLLAGPAAGGVEEESVRCMALRMLCTLGSTAPKALVPIWNAGFTQALQRALLRDHRELQGQAQQEWVWALRSWRAAAASGCEVALTLDDAYPWLCHAFFAQADASAWLWQATAEALWAAVDSARQNALASGSGIAMASSACLLSLQRATATWLESEATATMQAVQQAGGDAQDGRIGAMLSAVTAALVLLRATVAADAQGSAESATQISRPAAGASTQAPPSITALAAAMLEHVFAALEEEESVDQRQEQPSATGKLTSQDPAPPSQSAALCSAGLAAIQTLQAGGEAGTARLRRAAMARPGLLSTIGRLLGGGSLAAHPLLLQPEDAVRLVPGMHLTRLLAALLPCLLSAGACAPADAARVADAGLRCVVPGDDPTALALLSALCDPAATRAVLSVAGSAMRSPAAARLEELEVETESEAALGVASSDQPSLLHGLAAAWLGLEPERGPEEGALEDGPGPMPDRCLIQPALQPQGSRLPLPQGWLARVPASPEVAPPLDLSIPLALGLALLEGRNSMQASLVQPALAAAVQAAIPAVFLEPGTPSPGADSERSEPAWRQPAVRRALAGLLAALSEDVEASRSMPWTMPQAQALAAAYAAESYGDTLFGAAISLLLQAHVPAPVQTEVMDMLAQAGALHLLPPLDACPGGRTLVLGLNPHAPNPCPSLAQCLSLLNAGHLERSMHSMAMVYPMLLHRVARTLDTAPAGQDRMALAAALRRRAGTASGSRFVGDVCAWDWRTGRPGSEACSTRSALFDS